VNGLISAPVSEVVTTPACTITAANQPIETRRTSAERDALALQVIEQAGSITKKLKSLEDNIRMLWAEFDALPAGETILGHKTKKDFCEKRLNRTPRAVRYMLNGGNPGNALEGEILSPELTVRELQARIADLPGDAQWELITNVDPTDSIEVIEDEINALAQQVAETKEVEAAQAGSVAVRTPLKAAPDSRPAPPVKLQYGDRVKIESKTYTLENLGGIPMLKPLEKKEKGV
jgi:hypothetical protein